eukprot:gene39271-47792_t
MRLGNAYRMLLSHSNADAVFKKNFHSAEGYYSQAVLNTPGINVKIVGRGFDDFFREPVVLYYGKLYRCQAKQNITGCVSSIQQKYEHHFSANGNSLLQLPAPKYTPFQAYYDEEHCKMHWLPPDTRLCAADHGYEKHVALVQDKQHEVTLSRLGEVVLEKGDWYKNDEMNAPRQVHDMGALFHFRHWDDFISTSQSVSWPHNEKESVCMILYLRYDQAMAYEACAIAISKEVERKRSRAGSLLLLEAKHLLSSHDQDSSVSDALQYFKRKNEVGSAVAKKEQELKRAKRDMAMKQNLRKRGQKKRQQRAKANEGF